jgi:hypothetical protein
LRHHRDPRCCDHPAEVGRHPVTEELRHRTVPISHPGHANPQVRKKDVASPAESYVSPSIRNATPLHHDPVERPGRTAREVTPVPGRQREAG